MARKEKYSYGDNQQRKARLHRFEKELQQYVKDYRKEIQDSDYSMLPETEGLLKRLEHREYQKNPFLLPMFCRIPWQEQALGVSFYQLKEIWEEINE